MGVGRLQLTRILKVGVQVFQQLLSETGYLFLNLLLANPGLLQFILELHTFDLHRSFPFVLQYALVWLPVFRRRSVPRTVILLVALVAPQRGQVALDITARAASTGSRKPNAVGGI